MNDLLTPDVVAGTILALSALSYVLWPLVRPVSSSAASPHADRVVDELLSATKALDEIEDDYHTGKLTEGDYRELRMLFTLPHAEDVAEAAVRRARANQQSCPECGPRAESDAAYCSECGRPLETTRSVTRSDA